MCGQSAKISPAQQWPPLLRLAKPVVSWWFKWRVVPQRLGCAPRRLGSLCGPCLCSARAGQWGHKAGNRLHAVWLTSGAIGRLKSLARFLPHGGWRICLSRKFVLILQPSMVYWSRRFIVLKLNMPGSSVAMTLCKSCYFVVSRFSLYWNLLCQG